MSVLEPKGHIKDLFLATRWYLAMGCCVVLLFVSFFSPLLFTPAVFIVCGVLAATIADYVLLFAGRGRVRGSRIMAARFSLGDDNKVTLSLANTYSFRVAVTLIDELPEQFQERDFHKTLTIGFKSRASLDYLLRPRERGIYEFGFLLAYGSSPLGLVRRRFRVAEAASVKVYPSYLHLRKYQLMALGESQFMGSRRMPRLGHSLEFEKIKEYVQGDDVRTINWKASARKGNLMINTYTDARQQLIYCLVDKGRGMKMPFNGMTLLDYAINASLALLNVALLRQDKAGLITFSQKVNDIVPADRRNGQLHLLLETLYRQQTDFKETDYEHLLATTHKRLNQRSLMLLFTNFETMSAMQRQLPYLRRMASRHLLCVVFFRNALLKEIQEAQPDSVEGIYIKTIAEQFDFEKRQIVKELRRYGILSILTTPEQLSIDVVNKYLELKARQMV